MGKDKIKLIRNTITIYEAYVHKLTIMCLKDKLNFLEFTLGHGPITDDWQEKNEFSNNLKQVIQWLENHEVEVDVPFVASPEKVKDETKN